MNKLNRQTKIHSTLKKLLITFAIALLAACVGTGPYPGVPILGAKMPPPYKGPVAASQVAYRIDENRFFEVVPREDAACYQAGIFYTDISLGIHTQVMGLSQLGGVDLVIDAANTEYLIAPIIKGGGSCYNCGGSWLPFSTDSGRTWKQSSPRYSSRSEVYLIGDTVFYSGQRGKLQELTKEGDGWERFYLVGGNKLPPIRKRSQDVKFHCTPNGKE